MKLNFKNKSFLSTTMFNESIDSERNKVDFFYQKFQDEYQKTEFPKVTAAEDDKSICHNVFLQMTEGLCTPINTDFLIFFKCSKIEYHIKIIVARKVFQLMNLYKFSVEIEIIFN